MSSVDNHFLHCRIASIIVLLFALSPTLAAEDRKPKKPAGPDLNRLITDNDRVLFIGDEITQQMFYTRAVATALMTIKPEARIQFFNGGKDGASATSTLTWVNDLVRVSRPTVVFVCLGLNDGLPPRKRATEKDEKTLKKKPLSVDEIATRFRADMGKLIDTIRAHVSVREVIVLSCPAVQSNPGDPPQGAGENNRLWRLSQVAHKVAIAKGVNYVDLFEHTHRLYMEAARLGGESLTIGMRFPNETAHVVIASNVLYGIGVSADHLQAAGWSPLTPRRMTRIRGALVLKLKASDVNTAARSREIYEGIRRCDELFFKAWRISGNRPSAPPRQVMMTKVAGEWGKLHARVIEYYGSKGAAKK